MNKFVKDPVPIAVIGGSGAYHLLAKQSLGEEKKCQNIDTPYGKSAPIHQFNLNNSVQSVNSTPTSGRWECIAHGCMQENKKATVAALKYLN